MITKVTRTAIVLGATGLVGSELLSKLLEDPYFSSIKVLGRRSTGIIHSKLTEILIDFNQAELWSDHLIGDVLFLAFGSTLKKAGSKSAQYKIDYGYQFLFARLAAENFVPDCVLVSAPGASPDSCFFYQQIKGELDRDVAKLGFDRLVLIKPSVLSGKRAEKRTGEQIGIILGNVISWIPGIRKYRPIRAKVVAEAMIWAVKNPGDHAIMQYSLDELFKMKSSTNPAS
ncbi:MAG: NADH-quinone oxidoreductase subunit F [Bacteroidetes bacterium]|jgi:uncharacterized protein YbjT (DUF2867 family)|nr:NADH-quinone oxidoreductase subunit F [Bacteroidota bacterium]MBT3748439.1 NADH-quinone oxidoreductase subunit F [Bacteroidota bacterium]MBT4402116.1 NADH-quinone oxidoreductase subunit F [Bacteroidota bacterium]MBT4409120.1 NADH-quinone oxidoreductase subunit F [Bacteroidota bacterium]MBT7094320.1 NADH-quinone oxidoreductase subunit F [Bacteroidota bacterium]